MKKEKLTHKLVEFIPNELEEGIIYISMEYGCAIHLCCCGECGWKTVTPFGHQPEGTGWDLKIENEMVSLSPSIGNWQFPCKSHYWIKESKVIWA